MVQAIQLKVGNTIMHKGELCRIVKLMHVTPGKGHGMVQSKMINLNKGTNVDYRFRSNENAEIVKLEQKSMEYIYNDGDFYYFMDTETYEQIPIPKNFIGDSVNCLLPNIHCEVEFHENKPIGIELPKTVDMVITETEPQMKGATAAGSLKPAVTETGLTVQVPAFIKTGEKIKIDTKENKYIERAK